MIIFFTVLGLFFTIVRSVCIFVESDASSRLEATGLSMGFYIMALLWYLIERVKQ